MQQFFLNGGSEAYVVRVVDAPTRTAFATPPSVTTSGIVVEARNPGTWVRSMTIRVNQDTRLVGKPGARRPEEFNLYVDFVFSDPVTLQSAAIREEFRNVSIKPSDPNYAKLVVENGSALVRLRTLPATLTLATEQSVQFDISDGTDGGFLAASDLAPASMQSKQGMYRLEDADIFNILVIPDYSPDEAGAPAEIPSAVFQAAASYCRNKRAMLVANPPAAWTTSPAADAAKAQIDPVRGPNSVLYFPRIYFNDDNRGGQARLFSPAAAAAGIMQRVDTERGVWVAPAGERAKVVGAQGLQYLLSDSEHGIFNPIAINCLRTFPILGTVVWGARTLDGADVQGSQWKYLSVRRVTLFIEETLYRGTKFALFEPNDEPLWAQIRLNIGAFMNSLFRQGAFQGRTPKEAYFVKCDAETTTQDDINKGIVNVLVGFAPLKPVEFVVIKISQIAGQIPT